MPTAAAKPPVGIDRLVRARRKTIALVVEPGGRLTVRAPLHMADAHIRQFVEAHTDWIVKAQAKARLVSPPQPKQFTDGETFLYLGKSYPLTLVPRQRPSLTFDRSAFRLAQSALPKAQEAFTRWYKQQALAVFTDRVDALAKQFGFRYERIRISSARTRWGSCSSKGALSFTWRLVMAPPEVVDYVVIHELVHTKVRNHSKTFWARVGELMPGYKTHVRWLKQNGNTLTL
ncbi:MAG: M48 family metallopeptidase [Chloroflexi bacterium]|nr:M48 family metallopeptidase [Chloroflexota bacterium]